MTKVLVAGAIPEAGLNQLKEHFEVDMYTGDKLITEDELIERIKDAEGLISLLSTNVNEKVIEAAPNLKIIANYGAGFNNIDIQAARARGIDVTNTPIASTNATADLTMGILLAVARRIPEGDQLCRTKGFDMDILYSGPSRHEEKEQELGARYVSQDELLKEADFVAINCSYNESMRHMIDYNEIKKMKPTAYLINASRGPIVYEAELVKALQDGLIEGAALDVFEFEPEITEELKSMDNVVITPHIGNATFEARDMMAEIAAGNVVKALTGDTPDYIVNK